MDINWVLITFNLKGELLGFVILNGRQLLMVTNHWDNKSPLLRHGCLIELVIPCVLGFVRCGLLFFFVLVCFVRL